MPNWQKHCNLAWGSHSRRDYDSFQTRQWSTNTLETCEKPVQGCTFGFWTFPWWDDGISTKAYSGCKASWYKYQIKEKKRMRWDICETFSAIFGDFPFHVWTVSVFAHVHYLYASFRMSMFMSEQGCTGASAYLQMLSDCLEGCYSLSLLVQQNLSVLCVCTASSPVINQVSCFPVSCHLKRTLNVEVVNHTQLSDAFWRFDHRF